MTPPSSSESAATGLHLILVRHTPVAVPPGTCYGRLDVPLSPDWPSHFAALEARLPWQPTPADPVLTSPSRRCVQLAERLGGALRTDPRLGEFDFGEWEGKTWRDVPRVELDAWAADLAEVRAPGGESLAEVRTRATAVVAELLQAGQRRALIVTHGGVIRALVADLLGLPLAHAARLHVAFGGISEALLDGARRQLLALNR